MKKVQLFYDVISPYSWISFETICRYRTVWNIDVLFKPVFFGGILKATDNRGPATVPAILRYMQSDIPRLGKFYKVPLRFPSDPADSLVRKGTLQAMRFLTTTAAQRPDLTETLSRQLWTRIWHRDQDISKPESLLQVCQEVGLSAKDASDFINASREQPAKDRLTRCTQEAVDLGVFGVPTFILEDSEKNSHIVFGSDRLPLMAYILDEEYKGPLDLVELAATV